MKKADEILTEARTLIEKGWTQGKYARDADGNPISEKDPNACEWCALGAVYAAAGLDLDSYIIGNGNIEVDIALKSLCFTIPHIEVDNDTGFYPTTEISEFNDNKETTQNTIFSWFTRAIDEIQLS